MREMKDSGIEWIGEIPKDWKLERLQWHLDEIVEKNAPIVTTQVLSLTNKKGVIPYEEKGAQGNVAKESYDGYKIAYPNTIVANSMNILIGSVGYSNYYGCVSPVYYVFKEKDNNDLRFINYIMQTSQFQKELRRYANGILEIRLRVSSGNILKRFCAFPDYQEQSRIADYLDSKCSQIDAIIEKQQTIIEKLKEYKLSLITECVTKGLNPDVKMKDCNSEFIGIIPIHWQIVKLGMLFDYIGGYAYNSNHYVEGSENQVIRIGNVKNGYMPLENNPVFISDEMAENTERFKIKVGTILFTMTGTKGKRDYFFTHLVRSEDCMNKNLFLNQRVGCFIPRHQVCAGYYSYLLKTDRILDDIFQYETGTANQGNLGIDSIRRTRLQMPPLNEQKAIVEFLDNKCGSIENTIIGKQAIIEKMIEYKKSLIYEVVTGKKEI